MNKHTCRGLYFSGAWCNSSIFACDANGTGAEPVHLTIFMKTFDLNQCIRGWFIGGFDPSVIKTDAAEVAIKRYSRYEHIKAHYHKQSDKVIVVLDGEIIINGEKYVKDNIILIEKLEISNLTALTDATICVVNVPYIKDDKFEI